jgi:hypothetical protein
MKHDVFIAYARGDREIAAYLARRLEERGVSSWYDATLGAEYSPEQDVDAAIREAGIFTLLFSDECNRSDRIRRELALADSLGKPVVPFLLEGALPKGALLHPLADRNWIQAHPEPMVRVDEVAGLLVSLAGKAPPKPAPPAPPPSETFEEKERRLDAAIGEMIRDVVDPAHAPPKEASSYVGLTDGNGKPVKRLGGGGRTLLTVLTLGAYGVMAQRRAIERFRANIRKF